MSRIGNAPIQVPDGVTVTIEPARVAVAGPLGALQQQVPARMKIEQRDGEVVVTRPTERGEDRALHGLTRTLVANMVQGVTQGFVEIGECFDVRLDQVEIAQVEPLAGEVLDEGIGLRVRQHSLDLLIEDGLVV